MKTDHLGGRGRWGARVAIALTATTAWAQQPGETATQLEEITVTAQKREERLQDVPVPVTAISAEGLVQQNLVRLQDYYASVPGLNLAYGSGLGQRGGAPSVAIRGLTTGGGNPTVGITVDDVPYGSSSALGGGGTVPDIDPSDLARVEVLRGPQGTLYGASSLGGQLKFVTVDPSTESLFGRVQVGGTEIHNGDGAGYNVRAGVNIPLATTLGVRVSGFTRRDPGYIDNPILNLHGVNQADIRGGRLSVLWKPLDSVSVKLGALRQDTRANGEALVFRRADLDDLQQDLLRGTGRADRKSQVYSLAINAQVADVQLTSVSGYSQNDVVSDSDETPPYGAISDLVFGVAGAALTEHNRTSKFTQEVRASIPIGRRLQWLIGGYYTDENNRFGEQLPSVAPDTGAVAGSLLFAEFPTTYTERAAFTDLTFNINDQLNIQVGGRESQNRQTYIETDTGPLIDLFLGGSPLINPRVDTKDHSFTYLVTPQWKVSSDLMIYARLASGYRPGGPNPTSTVFGLPPSFRPDRTQNYELGAKGSLLDHRLSFDASVYHIDWRDIQLSLADPATGATYYANASRARSQGIELSLQSRPLAGLTLSASGAWNDAELTEDLPAGGAGSAVGLSGDKLPNSPRFAGHLFAEQVFALPGDNAFSVGAALTYVGDRRGTFLSTLQRQDYAPYAKLDLHVGLTHRSWSTTLSVNNIADRRGLLSGGRGNAFPDAFTVIQPRTVGVTVTAEF